MDTKVALIVFGLLLASSQSTVVRIEQYFTYNYLENESSWSDGITADLNDYIDTTIQRIIPFFKQQGLDSFALPDVDETFQYRPALITYSGQLTFEDGHVRGLTNLSLSGDQAAFYNNEQIRVRLQFQLSDINIYYRYQMKVIGVDPSGDLNGNLSRLVVVADVLVDINTDEISLLQVKLTERGTLSVHVNDHWLTGWLVNPLLSSFIRNVDDQILGLVEHEVQKVLVAGIANANNENENTVRYLKSLN